MVSPGAVNAILLEQSFWLVMREVYLVGNPMCRTTFITRGSAGGECLLEKHLANWHKQQMENSFIGVRGKTTVN